MREVAAIATAAGVFAEGENEPKGFLGGGLEELLLGGLG